jgi:predicted nucleic acid-binding protein
MSVLLDTNILTRAAQPGHPMHTDALDALAVLRARGEELCVVPQNLIESWAVATRPLNANGLEMNTVEAHAELTRIKSLFRLLPETPTFFPEWERLVVQHAVSGKNTHDARIVAAMNAHGVAQLLTFNGSDFKRFLGITSISPADLK